MVKMELTLHLVFSFDIKLFFLLMNIDASLRESSRIGGWTAVCRDDDADLRFTASSPMVNVVDAFHAKTKPIDLLDDPGVSFVGRGCNKTIS
jgi:hypothetical protein